MANEVDQHLAPVLDQDFDMLSDSGRHDHDIDIDIDIADQAEDNENDTPILDAPDIGQDVDLGAEDDVMQEEVEGVALEEAMLDGYDEQLVDEQMDDGQQGGVELDVQDELVDLDFELEQEVTEPTHAQEVTYDDAEEVGLVSRVPTGHSAEDVPAMKPEDDNSKQPDVVASAPLEGKVERVESVGNDTVALNTVDPVTQLTSEGYAAEPADEDTSVNRLGRPIEASNFEEQPQDLERTTAKTEEDDIEQLGVEASAESTHTEHEDGLDEEDYNEEQVEQEEDYSPTSHPAVVHYQDQILSLFPPSGDQLPSTFLLNDIAVAGHPLHDLFAACRAVLGETVDQDHSLVIEVPDMDLVLHEDDSQCSHATMAQVLEVYHRLHYNDEVYEPEPLKLILDFKTRLSTQLASLFSVADAGQGFQALKFEAEPVNDEPVAPIDETHTREITEGGEEVEAAVNEKADEEKGDPDYQDVDQNHDDNINNYDEADEDAQPDEHPQNEPPNQEETAEHKADENDLHENDESEPEGALHEETQPEETVQEETVQDEGNSDRDGEANQEADDLIDYSDDEDEVVPTTATTRSSTVQANSPNKESLPTDADGSEQHNDLETVQPKNDTHADGSTHTDHPITETPAQSLKEQAVSSSTALPKTATDNDDLLEITWDDEPEESGTAQSAIAATAEPTNAEAREDDFSLYSDDEYDTNTDAAAPAKAETTPPGKRTWSEHAEGQASEATEQDFKKVKST